MDDEVVFIEERRWGEVVNNSRNPSPRRWSKTSNFETLANVASEVFKETYDKLDVKMIPDHAILNTHTAKMKIVLKELMENTTKTKVSAEVCDETEKKDDKQVNKVLKYFLN